MTSSKINNTSDGSIGSVGNIDGVNGGTSGVSGTGGTPARAFAAVAARLCLCLVVFYVSQIIGSVAVYFLNKTLPVYEASQNYALATAVRVLFNYIVPLVIWRRLLMPDMRGLLRMPKKMGKLLANFPAVYGVGQVFNIATVAVILLLSRLVNSSYVETLTDKMVETMPVNTTMNAVITFVLLTVLAPLFEELMCRGVVMRALMPYGAGFAVIVSGVTFGLLHGNFNQFFFATAIGIIFGYISYMSNSLLPNIILHMLVNSISAFLMVFMSTDTVAQTLARVSHDSGYYGKVNPVVLSVFLMFVSAVVVLMLVGTVSAIRKLAGFIKRYRLASPFPQAELPVRVRAGLLLLSPAMIIAALFVVNAFAGNVTGAFIIRVLAEQSLT